ncbi:MAG: hypothetical protein ACP5VP_00460 [Candidatus Limnocylindrales bacterium]
MEPTPTPDLRLLPFDRAATLVAQLGFVLVRDEQLGDAGAPAGSHLVVALRDQPTLAHFDPERMTWYVTVAGKGQEVEYYRSRALPERTDVAWGPVHVFDRLEVQNTFVTFGGTLRVAQADPQTTLVVLDSPVPILRWSGHSQDVDPVAPEVAAFFARLLVPIDFTPGAEAKIAGVAPTALYAAFVADLWSRCQAAPLLRESRPGLWNWVAHEAHRFQAARPADWETGRQLLRDLDLNSVPAPTEPGT